MITVQFENVGRKHLTWTATMSELSGRNLTRAIQKKHALMSHELFFAFNTDQTAGTILAGIHEVGIFQIIETP